MSSKDQKIIRVGSRKSELALIQTKHVISCLQKLYPDNKFEIHTMTTMGDRVLNKSLPKIGEKSLFTKDLENALCDGGVDFVVHSLKDLPTALPIGMAIGAVLKREDPRDALVLNEKHKGKTLSTLPEGSVIGTSSLRRSAQLQRNYKNVTVCDIRGNLNTRLAKLDAEQSKFSGIILAQAGLVRMKWGARIDQVLNPSDLLYAVGQGALAVECRSNDEYILNMLSSLCHLKTQCIILAERSFLKTLGGGCSAPVAVSTDLKRKHDSKDFEMEMVGAIWSLNGKTEMQENVSCSFNLENERDGEEEEDGGASPSKRTKLDNDSDEVDDVSTPKKCPFDQKRKSPTVIDDSAASCSGLGSGDHFNINQLVNIHGNMYKKCPFAGKEKNGSEETKPETCPVAPQFSVGEDFMGECPFVDTQQKVELQEDLKCPVSGKSEMDLTKTNEIVPEKCPYVVQLLDYNENLDREIVQPKIVDNTDQLYCGMYRHKYVSKEIFDECEQLGIKLANKLIKKGALKVMKCAQDEIHSKTS